MNQQFEMSSHNAEVTYLLEDDNLVLYEEVLVSDPVKEGMEKELLEYQKKRIRNNEGKD